MGSSTFAAVLAVLLVALAGCAGAVESPNAVGQQAATEDTSPPTIGVYANGEVTADPDLALVVVAVEVTADSADAARQQAAADVARMREAIRGLGIPDDQVRTVSFSLSPEYDFSGERRELIGYTASHAFEIESDVDRAGAVIDAAVENGATRVSGVQFTLADETRRQLRGEALTEAMGNARADADTLAAAADVSITGVQSISTGEVGVVAFRAPVAEAGGGAGTVIEPGPVTVTAHVSVTYTIG